VGLAPGKKGPGGKRNRICTHGKSGGGKQIENLWGVGKMSDELKDRDRAAILQVKRKKGRNTVKKDFEKKKKKKNALPGRESLKDRWLTRPARILNKRKHRKLAGMPPGILKTGKRRSSFPSRA